MVVNIKWDIKVLRAISSEKRRLIIIEIHIVPRTVSDLSKILCITKPAVLKHLKILIEADLIYKKNKVNQFIYYDLTDQCKILFDTNVINGQLNGLSNLEILKV